MRKIKTLDEAYTIIAETEELIKAGHQLKGDQESRYIFAQIFLHEIGKRRKKQTRKSTY